VSEQDYKKNICYFKYFLRGNKKQIIKNLTKDMKLFSKNNDFENAAITRDQIFALNHLHEVAVGLRDDIFESEKVLFRRIECYDISNILGVYAVGAMSVITSGKIDTNEYRKFKIKTVVGADDLKMIAEILKRRFKNSWPKPDLIVIDGGINHLNIAKKILSNLKLDIPIISIAKGAKRNKDEFFFSDSNLAKYIKNTPEIQKYMILARNEAHRFAVNYYRLLHRKSVIS
jgi:excinuclease ABC subunit C